MPKIKIHNLSLDQLKLLLQHNVGFNLINVMHRNIVTIELTEPSVTNMLFNEYGITFTFDGECYWTIQYSEFSSISIL